MKPKYHNRKIAIASVVLTFCVLFFVGVGGLSVLGADRVPPGEGGRASRETGEAGSLPDDLRNATPPVFAVAGEAEGQVAPVQAAAATRQKEVPPAMSDHDYLAKWAVVGILAFSVLLALCGAAIVRRRGD